MKLYLIKNTDYPPREVAASNMESALHKYRNFLENSISRNYSSEAIFERVSNCECIGEYHDEDIIT